MPLLDHFHPPLSDDVPWEGFHSAWATMIAGGLNRELPPNCRAIPLTSRGPLVEIDVAAVETIAGAGRGASAWEPGKPGLSAALDWSERDLFEVRVVDRRGGRLVGAIELISPANKDRPAARRAFAGKCAGYLRMGVGLIIVDVVTNRSHDLHLELLELLELDAPPAEVEPLYAVAYRTEQQEKTRLDVWPFRLRVGDSLPTLPLWLSPDVAVPVDLARSYDAARELLRVE
jgi:hypothetical protein